MTESLLGKKFSSIDTMKFMVVKELTNLDIFKKLETLSNK